jgi:putative hydrolase of the HAD superfamily
MIKAVLFDFGGVLTQSGRSGFVTESVAKLYGVDPSEVQMQQVHADLRRGRGEIDALFAKLNQRYGKQVTTEMFVAETTQDYQLSPGVYDLAKRLRDRGIRTAIFSNIFEVNAVELRRRGAYDGFDPVLLSYEQGYAKPDPEFYDIAIKRLGVQPYEILLIDDQQKCLNPAQVLGMKVVEAVRPEQIIADVTAIIEAENGIEL